MASSSGQSVADTGASVIKLMREAGPPGISAEPTPCGFRLRTLRDFDGQFTHVRISNCMLPNAIAVATSPTMTIMQWYVPIDDTSCYWYSMFVSYGDPVDAETMRAQRISEVELPGYRPKAGAANRWGFDPDEQRTATFTGMGTDINVHDQWAVESPGSIFDRTAEHLSPSDVGIRTHRRMLFDAIREPSPATLIGSTDPAVLIGPAAADAATEGDDYDRCWREFELTRRSASAWAPALDD